MLRHGAVLQGRRHFLHGAEADSHGPVGPQSFPSGVWIRGRCPCLQVVQILRCCLCEDSAARRHPCRGADTDFRGAFYHRDSPGAVH